MSFHDQQYNEKRDFLRMRMDADAVLHLPEQGERLQVTCRDLSSQGVQLDAPQAVSPGTPIELSIPSPTPGLKGLEGKGSVVRCSATETGRYSIGVQFDSLK